MRAHRRNPAPEKENEMETMIRVEKRASGFIAVVSYPWGEKIRLSGCDTREDAQAAAAAEVERKKKYTLNKDLGIAAAALGRKGGQAKSDRKAASSRVNGQKGGRPRKEKK